MDKIHVLHVVGQMDFGGTEAFLMNLLRTIDREHYQFDFVEQTDMECAHDQEILSLGSKIYRCRHIGLSTLRSYRKWWREFYQNHPEYRIIHGHSRGSAPIYLDEARKAERITIAHCHNNSYGRGIQGAIRYVWQLPLRKIGDYNFACSYDSGVSQFGKDSRFEVVKNGIITEQFQWNPAARRRVREQYGLHDDEIVVGNVARFVEQKNHEYLIQIFKAIHERNHDTKLMLIGTGPLEREIKEKISQMGLSEAVLFVGNRRDVYDYYQAMDAFVLPSHFEGLGIVNIEAQESGLPCFASDKVVAPECAVTELMHFIPLEHTPQQWAEEVLRDLSKKTVRRSYTQEVKAAGFDIRETAERLCSFYRKALKECD